MVLLNLATKWIGYGRLLLAVILVLVFACGGDAKPTPAAITDSSGIEVVFDQSPQRIIAYDSAPVEILYAMGEGERVVGTHDFTTHPAEAVDIPKVGSAFQINSEKIVELEPDLIYTFYSGSLPDLEDLGIRVLYLEQPATLDEISEQMRMWGKITGKVEAAEGVATDFETGGQRNSGPAGLRGRGSQVTPRRLRILYPRSRYPGRPCLQPAEGPEYSRGRLRPA